MTGPCCVSRRPPRRLARRISGITASILPAAILMLLPKCPLCLAAWLTVATGILFATAGSIEKLKNDSVRCLEYTLKPGEAARLAQRPAITVYLDKGSIGITRTGGKTERRELNPGETVFSEASEVKNTGASELRFVRTEFLTEGKDETWGHAGLAPNYKLLIENKYARVYDIRIPAHEHEPQHTHHARVVVCLSGAKLKHIMPDGREEPSTLETGEVAFRGPATHIGQNLGDTNLWVIAIEPK